MTTAAPGPAAPGWPRSAAEMLFGPSADAPEALARHITATGGDLGSALKQLPRTARQAAVREAAAAAAGLLKVDLLGVLVSGWREHKEITAAARRTLTMQSSRELVSLPPHRVATAQEPSVSILVDGKRVGSLRLGLSIVFDVEALVAGIAKGRLSVIHAGRCALGLALTVHGVETVSRQAHLELPRAFPIGTGIRLLPGHKYPPGMHPGAESPGGAADAQVTDPQHAYGEVTAAQYPDSRFPAAQLDDRPPEETGHPSGPPQAVHTVSDSGLEHPAAGGPPPWWDNLQDASG